MVKAAKAKADTPWGITVAENEGDSEADEDVIRNTGVSTEHCITIDAGDSMYAVIRAQRAMPGNFQRFNSMLKTIPVNFELRGYTNDLGRNLGRIQATPTPDLKVRGYYVRITDDDDLDKMFFGVPILRFGASFFFHSGDYDTCEYTDTIRAMMLGFCDGKLSMIKVSVNRSDQSVFPRRENSRVCEPWGLGVLRNVRDAHVVVPLDEAYRKEARCKKFVSTLKLDKAFKGYFMPVFSMW
jgi:hypothetical protein